MEIVDEDIDAFLRGAERSAELVELDALIRAALPGIRRTLWRGKMWGGTEQAIVGYGLIRQPRPKGAGVEWFLVGMAEQKRHLSVYVNAAESGKSLVQLNADRLGKVRVGAAAVTFREIADLDIPEFQALLMRARQLFPDA